MSVIVSFPLMVYPLRASLHSLMFQQVSVYFVIIIISFCSRVRISVCCNASSYLDSLDAQCIRLLITTEIIQ